MYSNTGKTLKKCKSLGSPNCFDIVDHAATPFQLKTQPWQVVHKAEQHCMKGGEGGGGKRELHLPIWTRQMYVKGSLRQIVFTNFYAGRRYSRILLHCPKDFYHREFHGPEVLSVCMNGVFNVIIDCMTVKLKFKKVTTPMRWRALGTARKVSNFAWNLPLRVALLNWAHHPWSSCWIESLVSP